METHLEFKIIGNDIYCRRFAVGDLTGNKIILSRWYFYTNTLFV